MGSRRSVVFMTALLAVSLVPASASAGASATYREDSDVGSLLGSAERLKGTAGTPYAAIEGTIDSDTDVDLYEFCAGGPRVVASTAKMTKAPGELDDTTLVLFDRNGAGIWVAEDIEFMDWYSTITASGLVKGRKYYLAVTSYSNRPTVSGGGFMFPEGNANNDAYGQWAPFNGTDTLEGWSQIEPTFGQGTYTVQLRNVEACAKPGRGG